MSAAILGLLLVCLPAWAQTSILTQHYDVSRTGQNTAETLLTTSNVNSSAFGKLFQTPVDGYVYAQPLYVPAVAIPQNGSHNVLYVATEHDSLYAFDADSGSQLWRVSFLINGATTVSPADVGGTQDINPEIGITGTPTIDPATNTLYVVAKTKENGKIIHRLHAIDITNGAEKLGGPVLITASVPGTAGDGNGSTVPLNSQWANQRPGLLLLNQYLYIGFSSHGDDGPWHGWVLGYDKTTLTQTGAWCTSPNGKGNGIWGAGSGLAADASGNMYVATGNGDDTVTTPAPPPSATIDYGDSIVRLALTNGVPVPTDYFTPHNQALLDSADLDLGSGGVLILPDQSGTYPHILIQSGKDAEIYVVNRDQMTTDNSHYCNGCTSDPEIIQSLPIGAGLWSMPAYWNNQIYVWGNGGHLEAYALTNGTLSNSPTSQSAESSNFPGSTPVVSSNGTGNGIVWAVETDAYNSGGPAILRAYSATNVSNLLYGSNLTNGRDTLGPAVKFVVPVVANGKVYVGAEKEVDVFGLLSGESQAAAPVFNPPGGSYNTGTQITMTTPTPSALIYYTTDGTAPVPGQGTTKQYVTALTLTSTTTVKAIATAPGETNSATTTATYTLVVATPVIIPGSESFSGTLSVSITDTTSGSTIYYTTDGSAPVPSQGTTKQYLTTLTLSSTTTVNAVATAPGDTNSPTAAAAYTLVPTQPAATPVITPKGGKISTTQPISITDATTAAAIFYTTDGSTPSPGTGTTHQYGLPFTLPASATVKAIATASGFANSALSAQSFTVQRVVVPVLTPSGGAVLTTQTISITDGTSGAAIYFTTDGTTPSPGTGTTQQYLAPFTLSSPATVKAIATETGFQTSALGSATYTFQKASPPVVTPKNGTIATTQTINLTDTTAGAAIYYTTDGTVPVPGQGTTQQFSSPFTLSASGPVKAIATSTGYLNSALTTTSFTLQRATNPTLSPTGGAISTGQPIALADTTPGAVMYYTTDGSLPSPGIGTTKQYSSPFTLPASATVKSIAVAPGYMNSAMAQANYTVH